MPLNYVVTQKSRNAVGKLLNKRNIQPGKYIVLLMDGRELEFKSWPTEYYRALAFELYEKTSLQIVFEGTRGGRSSYEMLDLDEHSGFHSLHGILSLPELAALLEQAALVVGIDSGPIHLAQAVGTKSLALFGCTDERRWGAPDLTRHQTIRASNAPFNWTLMEAKRIAHREHMRRLLPNDVAAQALRILEN